MENDETLPAEFPGVSFEEAKLRVVLTGGGTFHDELQRTAAQHYGIMAMRPKDVDDEGGGPGKIIADFEQFPGAERYADLFAAAPELRSASQELYDRLQDYLDVSDEQLVAFGYDGLVEAMDAIESVWRKADGIVPEIANG